MIRLVRRLRTASAEAGVRDPYGRGFPGYLIPRPGSTRDLAHRREAADRLARLQEAR